MNFSTFSTYKHIQISYNLFESLSKIFKVYNARFKFFLYSNYQTSYFLIQALKRDSVNQFLLEKFY